MERANAMRASGCFETKVCPRCGAELYADMNVCYGCLYDFSRDAPRPPRAPLSLLVGEDGPEDTVNLAAAAGEPLTERVGMMMRTSSVDVWIAVSDEGVSIGRAPENDVVLHSPAISGRHLSIVPTPDGMEVSDLDSTNPARYHGREVRGRVIVSYGDTIDVCGCILTMTGPTIDVY
ncbi:FHA domain-containing protein [Thermophilibacter provencensis]|uniref:FHA domain-containing protein n=1 Tax=Thermophilibacter provencensis TaxID=1852386 RepID=A0ABT7V196_9ACTN|nr:FHA domain-containing protein [Thermophilibacter provencensis]MDM8270353.1 FHA domain-containing protein [Thermophilibacter provencensis]